MGVHLRSIFRSKEQDHGPDRMGVELLHLRPVHTINPVHPEEETEQTGRITLGNLQVIRQRHPSHLSVTIAESGSFASLSYQRSLFLRDHLKYY